LRLGGTTSHELKPVAAPLYFLHLPSAAWSSLAPHSPLHAPLPAARMRPALCAWPGQGLLVFGGGPWQCLEATDSAAAHDADAFLLRIDSIADASPRSI
jgi:hypothetical protein